VTLLRPQTLAALLAATAAVLVVARPVSRPPSRGSVRLEVAGTERAERASLERGRDRRPAWALSPPAWVRWRGAMPEDAELDFALATEPPGANLRLRLRATQGGAHRVLHEETGPVSGGWAERRLTLSGLAAGEAELELTAEGDAATVYVSEPRLVGRPQEPRPPNVILYVVDCLRADHVGAYGYSRPTTPEIDRLARDGVLLAQVQACASWTKPAVGCLFTGLYPVLHGAQTVDDVLDPGRRTLAEAFRDAGYATAAWIANPFVSANPFGLTRGFQQVVQVLDKPPLVNINDLPADAADITRRVLPWLRDNRDRRFFLYLHSLDAHAGYRRRPPFDRVFVRRERKGEARQLDLYDNEVAYNDREIGRLVEALKRERLYDSTLIAVTADHGEEFGEHGFTRHGHTLYQALLHVPLVLKLPGSGRRDSRVEGLASSLDLAPTLLDLAGLPVPADLQGMSLRPAIESGSRSPRSVALSEQLSPKEVLYAGRDQRFKYVYQLLPSPGEWLFDLSQDPGELHDLLPEAPPAARGLIDEVLRFMQGGQSGYHVQVTGDPDTRGRLEIEADGALGDVQRFAISAGERLEITADRRRLDYAFSLGDSPRHLVVRTQPAAAALRLRLSLNGKPVPARQVALGPSGRNPEAIPTVVRGEDVLASPGESAALVKGRGARLSVWYVPPPAATRKAAIDPELEQKLRALGYLQ
jgi:arylsulfatase A-like enzyme